MAERGAAFILGDPMDEMRVRLTRIEAKLDALGAQPQPGRDAEGGDIVWPTGHRPEFWFDLPVRKAAIALHGQMKLMPAAEKLAREFGAERAPSKSALQRLWNRISRQGRPKRRAA